MARRKCLERNILHKIVPTIPLKYVKRVITRIFQFDFGRSDKRSGDEIKFIIRSNTKEQKKGSCGIINWEKT